MHRLEYTLAAVIMTVLLSSCIVATELVAPPKIDGPRFTYDCTLGPSLCGQINGAISRLEGSSNSNCEFAGSMARLRFEAEGYGYRAGNPSEYPQYDAYVIQEQDWSWYSGFGPTDYNTYANPSFFSRTEAQMAGLIAHEEQHQGGWDNPFHSTGIANSFQDQCTL